MREVPLYGKIAAGRVAFVDDGDYDLVMQHRWHVWEEIRSNGTPHGPYARTRVTISGTTVRFTMHNLIMGIKGVDHRDSNGLNNQRSNLRLATVAENARNKASHRGSSSQYKGVYWNKRDKHWHARIRVNYRLLWLGSYLDETEAARAYDTAAAVHFGEFAVFNFPKG